MMKLLSNDERDTHNGHKLLPLKERLTKSQQSKRRQKIMAKGTRMEKLEQGLGQTQQAMIGAFGATNKRASFHRKMMYAMHSVTLIGIIYHVGHSFGWW